MNGHPLLNIKFDKKFKVKVSIPEIDVNEETTGDEMANKMLDFYVSNAGDPENHKDWLRGIFLYGWRGLDSYSMYDFTVLYMGTRHGQWIKCEA